MSAPLYTPMRTALSRELARMSNFDDTADQMRNLTRTLEIIFWIIAVLIGLLIIAASPIISQYWFKPKVLSHQEVLFGLCAMGLALALQWPLHLYTGGLIGLQRQVGLSILNIVMLTIRYAGVIPILWWVSPTIQAFFLWQGGASIVHTLLARSLLWYSLPKHEHKPTFRKASLKSIWRFAARSIRR